MPGRDRERRLARQHWERQQARRAALATRRRRRTRVLSAVAAVTAVVAALVVLSVLRDDSAITAAPTPGATATPATSGTPTTTGTPGPTSSPAATGTPGATATPTATATTAAGCRYPQAGEAARDVGLPTYDPKTATTPYTATVTTGAGRIVVEALAERAPCTTTSFRFLAEKGYFDDTRCHRLTTAGIFVLQCGDPTGTGTGGPGYSLPLENAPLDGTYPAGTVAMARGGDPASGGSQFFFVYDDSRLPAPGYTVFGRVTQGTGVLADIAAAGTEGGVPDGPPAQDVTIESVDISGT